MKPTTPDRTTTQGNRQPTEHIVRVELFATLWMTLLICLPLTSECSGYDFTPTKAATSAGKLLANDRSRDGDLGRRDRRVVSGSGGELSPTTASAGQSLLFARNGSSENDESNVTPLSGTSWPNSSLLSS